MSEPARQQPDYAPGLEAAFAAPPREGSYAVREIEGRLPDFLRGTCYLTGPARFARGGFSYRHWLDGDGMVCALRFESGRVTFTNRFVQSTKLRDEEAAGRPLYRAFGTAFPGDRLVRGVALASPVNVSVYPWGDALLAFGEQGLPWELDPRTLATRGEFTFGGALGPLAPFAAHPHIDPGSGELYNFGVSFAAAEPRLNLYRFDPSGRLVYRRRLPLEHPSSLHDFGLSQRHAAFYVAPYLLDVEAFLRRGKSLMESLSWRPQEGSRLLVAARASGEEVASVPIGDRYCLHLVNCFEEGERLTVDVLELEEPVYDEYEPVPDLFRDVSACEPVRFVVDLSRGDLVERRALPWGPSADFPAIDTRRSTARYEHFWMLSISATGLAGRKFFDQLVHADWSRSAITDIWQAPRGLYLAGEPVFAPDPGSDTAGAVVVPAFAAAARQSSFLVFDALDVGAGPVATLHLESPIHLAFHAFFQGAADQAD